MFASFINNVALILISTIFALLKLITQFNQEATIKISTVHIETILWLILLEHVCKVEQIIGLNGMSQQF